MLKNGAQYGKRILHTAQPYAAYYLLEGMCNAFLENVQEQVAVQDHNASEILPGGQPT